MTWEPVTTEAFAQWWDSLSQAQQIAITARVDLLKQYGPALGRPVVDHIEGSRHQNMKELRISKGGALRVLFAFDPMRQAVLLIGGDKSGRFAQWYREAIAAADDLFDAHLRNLEEQGR